VDIDCVVSEQTTAHNAVATAEQLGYPLVAKIISADVVHKTDVGGVIMRLQAAAQVAQAVDTLGERRQRADGRMRLAPLAR
jgi:acetyltransferase